MKVCCVAIVGWWLFNSYKNDVVRIHVLRTVSEFRTFVEATERELLSLFQSIDRDQNGKLDKGELRAAFRTAGLAVPSSKLDHFFSEVDTDHDGVISFDEWR